MNVKKFLTHLTAEQLAIALQYQDADLNGHLHEAARALEELLDDDDDMIQDETARQLNERAWIHACKMCLKGGLSLTQANSEGKRPLDLGSKSTSMQWICTRDSVCVRACARARVRARARAFARVSVLVQ